MKEREFEVRLDVLDHSVWFEGTQYEILEEMDGQIISINVESSSNDLYVLDYKLTFPGGMWSDALLTPDFDPTVTPLTDEGHFNLDPEIPEDRQLLATLDAYFMRHLLEELVIALRQPWPSDDEESVEDEEPEDDEDEDEDDTDADEE